MTTILFTVPGYLPGIYSSEIEGAEFAELWQRFYHLRTELDAPRFDPLRSLRCDYAEHEDLVREDNRNADEFIKLRPVVVALISAWIQYEGWEFLDDDQPQSPVIPWADRFEYRHPISGGKEQAKLLNKTGWDAPLISDLQPGQEARFLRITASDFYLS